MLRKENVTLSLVSLATFIGLVLAPATASADENLVSPYLYPLQTGPAVASDTQGNLAMAWMSAGQYEELSDLSGRFYGPGGWPRHEELQINQYFNHDQIDPRIAITETGMVGIMWTTENRVDPLPPPNTPTSRTAVARFYFLELGAPWTNEITFDTVDYESSTPWVGANPQICASEDDFVLAFVEGIDHDIYAQRYNGNGLPQGPRFMVVGGHDGHPFALECFPDGSFAVAWESDSAIRLQKFELPPANSPAWAQPAVIAAQWQFVLATLSDGTFQVAYVDFSSNIMIKSYPGYYVPGVTPEPQPELVRDSTVEPDWDRVVGLDIGAKVGTTVVAWIEKKAPPLNGGSAPLGSILLPRHGRSSGGMWMICRATSPS